MASAALMSLAAIAAGTSAAVAAPTHQPIPSVSAKSGQGTASARGLSGGGTTVKYASAKATGALATVLTEIVHGGYTAAGVGMRNLGHGTISIDGIPAGATVKSATLLWDVLATHADRSFALGTLNGKRISGGQWASGPSPCWAVAKHNWSYDADVTRLVTGNGSYKLSDFASGDTDGRDPWTVGSNPPLLEGASLVVVYEKSSMRQVVIQIGEGASETQLGKSAEARLNGFAADASTSAKTTYIVADGQAAGNTAAFNGSILPDVGFTGADPQAVPDYSRGNLWDTVTADIGSHIHSGDTSATMAITGHSDCLVWVGQVLEVAGTGFAMPNDWHSTTVDSPLPGWDPINMIIMTEGYSSTTPSAEDVVSALKDDGLPWFSVGIGHEIRDVVKGKCISRQDAAVIPGDPTRSEQDFSWRRVKPLGGSGCLSLRLLDRGYTSNHARGYYQRRTGAWFLAVSEEKACDLKPKFIKFIPDWHCITPNGYDQGRDQLIADLKRLPGYKVEVNYVQEYGPGAPPEAAHDPLGFSTYDGRVAVVIIERNSPA